jgi:hypothetical protein
MSTKAIVLPTAHGKTTLHNIGKGIVDAGSLIEHKEILRELRAVARHTGDWTQLDMWWCDRVKSGLPENCKYLLVPSTQFAEACHIEVAVTLILPIDVVTNAVLRRPKSGLLNALENRLQEESLGKRVVHVSCHEDIAVLIEVMLGEIVK